MLFHTRRREVLRLAATGVELLVVAWDQAAVSGVSTHPETGWTTVEEIPWAGLAGVAIEPTGRIAPPVDLGRVWERGRLGVWGLGWLGLVECLVVARSWGAPCHLLYRRRREQGAPALPRQIRIVALKGAAVDARDYNRLDAGGLPSPRRFLLEGIDAWALAQGQPRPEWCPETGAYVCHGAVGRAV